MVPTVVAHRLHVHHELQHDGAKQISIIQRAEGFDSCLDLHLGHHPSLGHSGQPQTPSKRCL